MTEDNKWEEIEVQMEKQQKLLEKQQNTNPEKLTEKQKLLVEKKLIRPPMSEDDNIEQKSIIQLFEELSWKQKTISENLNDFSFDERKILRTSFKTVQELYNFYNKKLPFKDTKGIKALLKSIENALDVFIASPNNSLVTADLKTIINLIKRYKAEFGKNLNKNQFEENILEKLKNTNNENTNTQLLMKRLKKLEEVITEQNSKTYISEIVEQSNNAKELFDKAKSSESLVNAEIKALKEAKEGHINYVLSKELQEKSNENKTDVEEKRRLFLISLGIVVIINATMLFLYAKYPLIKDLGIWELIVMKISLIAPFVFYVFFCLNEYTKAKRLYEEFDYKRIMTQTLMNNFNMLKTDFTKDEDKLLDLLKTPIEKIFDNPVHSVYGDKSGDKGLGLDQLEKLVSIASKFKDKKD